MAAVRGTAIDRVAPGVDDVPETKHEYASRFRWKDELPVVAHSSGVCALAVGASTARSTIGKRMKMTAGLMMVHLR